MPTQPKALIITGYGINCEEETAKGFAKKGADSEIIHINDLIASPQKLEESQILAFPGGFSYGDDTGSGNAFANRIKNNLGDKILKFASHDKLIIGICNGFQIITNLGLLPEPTGERKVALMRNIKARYECRWTLLKNNSKKCIWTNGIETLHIPVAHGEGNFYAAPETLETLKNNDQIVFTYTKPDGSPADQEYPHNPNGALADIAGICDSSGRILGMMPHPERFFSFENEDGWELKKEQLIRAGKQLPKEGAGLKVFENAVKYFR